MRDRFFDPPQSSASCQLGFEYRGEQVAVPVARNYSEFYRLMRERVRPGIQAAKGAIQKQGQTGGAFMYFYHKYSEDDFEERYPQAAGALIEAFRQAGLPVASKPVKLDSLYPTPHNLIANLQTSEGYITHDDLQRRTFIVGPLLYDQSEQPHDRLISYGEQARRCRAWIPGCIGIDGGDLLAIIRRIAPSDLGNDRVQVRSIARLIDQMVNTSSTALIPHQTRSLAHTHHTPGV